jgi:hypothetical protein
MGRHEGGFILPHLKLEVQSPENAAIIHVGDFAYDLNSEGGIVPILIFLRSKVYCMKPMIHVGRMVMNL